MTITAPLFRPNRDGPPQPVDIVQILPNNFPDGGVFTEVAETLVHGFRALGYDAALKINSLRISVPTIVLAAHLLNARDAKVFPVGAIIYNLEQIRPGAWAANADYFQILRRHTVWDFSAGNVAAIIAATGNHDVHHAPIGYVPSLTRITPAPEQDIDVLFYGSITPRRRKLFEAFAASGLKLHVVFRAYGAQRDALIARSKVVLCLHAHDNWDFEIVRVSWLLANRKAVVCEAASPEEIDADLRDGLRSAPYDGLIEACARLIADDAARRALEKKGFDAFSARSQTTILERILTVPVAQSALPSTTFNATTIDAMNATRA